MIILERREEREEKGESCGVLKAVLTVTRRRVCEVVGVLSLSKLIYELTTADTRTQMKISTPREKLPREGERGAATFLFIFQENVYSHYSYI